MAAQPWSRATIRVHGQTGTGKELVAHAIHARTSFVAVNCAAFPPPSLLPVMIQPETTTSGLPPSTSRGVAARCRRVPRQLEHEAPPEAVLWSVPNTSGLQSAATIGLT